MSVALDDILHLVPVGCSSCGGTNLEPKGDNRYQCVYCDSVIVRDPPPPLPPVVQDRGGEIPPESARSQIDADQLRVIDVGGGPGQTVDTKIVLAAVDARGPTGPLTRRPLSGGISVGKAKQHAPVRVMYTCFCERRSIEQTVQPYTGQVPSQDPIPQPWAEPPRELSEPSEERLPLRVKEVVADCETCRGSGSQSCGTCSGNGRNDCSFCTDGKRSDGSTCSSCGGNGFTECATCSGNGRVGCTPCGGKGQVLKGHELLVVHEGRTRADAMSSDRDWGDLGWLEEAEGELLFDQVSAGMTTLAEADGPIYELANEVVQALNEELDREVFVFWSRLTVTRIPVIEAEYGLGSTDTGQILHVYGRQRGVSMPGARPWGCGCFSMGAPVVLAVLLAVLVYL